MSKFISKKSIRGLQNNSSVMHTRALSAFVFFLSATVCSLCNAGSLHIGAGLHLGQGKHDAGMAAASLLTMGLTSFRDEIYWARFEGADGKFNIERIPSELRKALEHPQLGPQSMIILGYGNKIYDGGGQPISDTGRSAFTRYALEVAKTYPQIGYLEIWNEWNHPNLKRDGPRGHADDYMALVKTTSTALRKSGTKSKIVVGGLADDFPDWTFARSLVKQGILRYGDAFSVHLYNYSNGEKAVPEEMIDRLKRLQDILRNGNDGKDFPILITEMGWPTHEGRHGTSEVQSGEFISQFLFEVAAYPWIQGVWIYELFNSGTLKAEREHNFGILKHDGAAKAGTCVLRESIDLLKNARFVASGMTRGKARWMQYKTGEKSFVVAYSPSRSTASEIGIQSKLLKSARRLCEENPISPFDLLDQPMWTSLKVSNTPVVIWIDSDFESVKEKLR